MRICLDAKAADKGKREAWMGWIRKQLDAGRVDRVIAALKQHRACRTRSRACGQQGTNPPKPACLNITFQSAPVRCLKINAVALSISSDDFGAPSCFRRDTGPRLRMG